MDKKQVMEQLLAEAELVHAASCDPDTRIVWGEGNFNSPLVLIGEAPGAQENKQGRPFVGPAGKLLNDELESVGIKRDQIYITNVVKCRPTQISSGRISNRAPNAGEIKAWVGLLIRELGVIGPKVILCLGAVSASALIYSKFAIKSERGQWFDGPLSTRAMATYHPSYLLRAQDYGNSDAIDQFRADLAAAKEDAFKP